MHIAGDLCVYTNHTTVMEILYKDLPISVNLTNPSESIKQLMLFAGQQYTEQNYSARVLSKQLIDSIMTQVKK